MVLALLLLEAVASRLHAADPCTPETARIVSLQGTVELRRAGTERWAAANLDDPLCLGDMVRVGPFSRVGLAFANNSVLRLDQRTTLHLRAAEDPAQSLLGLLQGAVYFFSRQPRALTVDTPFVNAGAEGTEFFVRVGTDTTLIIMYEGRVRATNPQGEILLTAGEAAVARAGEPPRPEIVARPRDAVAWTLYYPPILAALAGPGAAARPLPRPLSAAAELAAANDYAAALAVLDEVPAAARDGAYWVFRAGVLLNVGQADEAQQAIQQALRLQPDFGPALAQRAIIAVVQNRDRQALEDARHAVKMAPDAPPAYVALSYALQANFQLEAAREVLNEAASRFPEDALVFARLSEIELSLGYLDRALDAASRAVALEPDLARTQMVLGFAELAQFDTDEAEAAFRRAIELDSAEPLARLGLGLAQIRESDLAEGRREIEIAAALDPNDSLIRSYLGKAYFEENRDRLASEQLQIAKQLDPNDPTPWFYGAIQKQLENRPVEALHDLQRSIELNDNRAVFRSRLLLDEDLAMRSASLARIYDDLGFEQVGLLEATRSLSLDPANWSAHRFLSDTYAALPRHEIARASELLQAQLLQPINLNPIQPSLPITDLNIVRGIGPAEAAFNEFTPLFARNGLQLTGTGVVGTQDTLGDEVVASGLWNRYSASAGQFHFQSDGFRPNNDLETDLYDVFGQVALGPSLSLQAEYRHRDSEQGDLVLNFTPDRFDRDDRETVRQDTARVGATFRPAPQSTLISSVIYTDRREIDEFPSEARVTDDSNGYQIEGQYLHTTALFNLVVGLGFYDVDGQFKGAFFSPPPTSTFSQPFERQQDNAYVYVDARPLNALRTTLGVSYDDFQSGPIGTDKLSPKLGVTWEITNNIILRLAAFDTVKRALVVDQTIEPTQIAGFNQFFDDFNGSDARQYSAALDTQLTRSLYSGIEFIRREVDIPGFAISSETGDIQVVREDTFENMYRLYLYWAPHKRWALTSAAEFYSFNAEVSGEDLDRPTDIDTFAVPVSLSYFSPSGLFSTVTTTWLNQDVERTAISDLSSGTDDVAVVDGAVGYRLPYQRGIISLEVRNLFNETFAFQDDNFRTSEERWGRFVPGRTVFGRVTLNF